MDIETCPCDLCAATRVALDAGGFRNRRERQFIRDLVETQAMTIDVMTAAEDAGFNLERPEVDALLDAVFNDEPKPTLN